MSDQPKPTGEWTAEGLRNAFDQIGCKNLADELNAALAAERGHHKQEEIAATELARQLAAECEKVQPLVALLEEVLQETVDAGEYPDGPCLDASTRLEIKDAIVKVRERK